MNKAPLFRPEAIAFRKNHHYGTISVNTPYPFKVVAMGALAIIFIIGIYSCTIAFNSQFSVRGYLNSSKGIVQVYPQKNGTITQCLVKQGDNVKAGDLLFKIDTYLLFVDQLDKKRVRKELIERRDSVQKLIDLKTHHISSLRILVNKKLLSPVDLNQQLEELATLTINRSVIEMEIIHYEQARGYLIKAPISGRIASINYQLGQSVHAEKPLLKIIPAKAEVLAELFVPVRQAGFLNDGDRITIHYDSYPYQRFGGFPAKITQISETLLTDDEEEKPFKIGEPYYKVVAKLEQHVIQLKGKTKVIQPGLTFTGLILSSKKTIVEWIFESL